MSLILQTMITNKVTQDRTLRWAGKRGVFVAGLTSVIVEGAYPTACRTPAGLKCLEAEITQGLTEIKLVTNIETVKPVGAKGAVKNPVAVQGAAKSESEAIPLTEYPNTKQERFHTVEDGVNPLEPDTVTLPGNDVSEIPEPVTKAMFPEGTTLAQEGQETIEPVADAPAEAPAEVTPEVTEEVTPEVTTEAPAEDTEATTEVTTEAPAEEAKKEAPKTRRKRTAKK